MKYVDSCAPGSPTNGGPQDRLSSPPGDSTLITRAPRSPSIIPACGPASARVRSSTTRSEQWAAHARSRPARRAGPVPSGRSPPAAMTRPAPTWPTPATLPAIPVLICGRIPVRQTRVTSMPVGRALELQDRHRPARVLAEGDLVHPPGGRQRVGHRAADEPDDRGRRRHREPADPGGLGDRRVADVRVGVVGAVVPEVEAVGELRRPGEPLVAGAGHLDPEVGAVARHRHHHRRPVDPAGRVERELAGRHREVEEEVVVAADEPDRLGHVGDVRATRDHRRGRGRAAASGCRPGCGCGPRRPSAASG